MTHLSDNQHHKKPVDTLLIIEDKKDNADSIAMLVRIFLAQKGIEEVNKNGEKNYEILIAPDLVTTIDIVHNPNNHIVAAAIDNGFKISEKQIQGLEIEKANDRVSSSGGKTAGIGTRVTRFFRKGITDSDIEAVIELNATDLARETPVPTDMEHVVDKWKERIPDRLKDIDIIFHSGHMNDLKLGWLKDACNEKSSLRSDSPESEVEELGRNVKYEGNKIIVDSHTFVREKTDGMGIAQDLADAMIKHREKAAKPDLTAANSATTDIKNSTKSHGQSQQNTP